MRRLLTVVLAAVLLALASPALARASWTAGLPPNCDSGTRGCVDKVAAALTDQVRELQCSHNAIFAVAYRRITQRVAEAVGPPTTPDAPATLFADPAYIARFDVAFAREYGRNWDAWAQGRRSQAAPAWRAAFDNAHGERVTGTGNLMLAINAHIGRDMPLVLERVGLSDARKADQDRVNAVLLAATEPLIRELAADYDPTMDDTNLPGTGDDAALYQYIAGLRERAWRLAQELDSADGQPLRKAAIRARIEAEAQTNALLIATSYAYVPGLGQAAARDAYCATRGPHPRG
jgi:hypothetical protein